MQHHAFGREVGQSFVMSREGVDEGSGARSNMVLVEYAAW